MVTRKKVKYCKVCGVLLVPGENIPEGTYANSDYKCRSCKANDHVQKTLKAKQDLIHLLKNKTSEEAQVKHLGGGLTRYSDHAPNAHLEQSKPMTTPEMRKNTEPNYTVIDRKQKILAELLTINKADLEPYINGRLRELRSDLELYEFMKGYLIS